MLLKELEKKISLIKKKKINMGSTSFKVQYKLKGWFGLIGLPFGEEQQSWRVWPHCSHTNHQQHTNHAPQSNCNEATQLALLTQSTVWMASPRSNPSSQKLEHDSSYSIPILKKNIHFNIHKLLHITNKNKKKQHKIWLKKCLTSIMVVESVEGVRIWEILTWAEPQRF